MINELKAKELFKKYNCNTFYMGRESMADYNTYKDFKITRDKELEWIHEYQVELIKICHLSTEIKILHDNFLSFCISKSNFPDLLYLDELISLIDCKKEKLDSFTKMRMAEDILKLIVNSLNNHGFSTQKVTMKLKKIAIEMLKDVVSKPVIVNTEYSLTNSISKDTLLPENIIFRAKSTLKDWT